MSFLKRGKGAALAGAYDSVQIWYEPNPNIEKVAELEIDVNVCKITRWSKRKTYLDFGLQIYNPSAVKNIKLYIPISLTENLIQDLSGHFTNDDFRRALFNEKYDHVDGTKRITIKEKNKNKFVIQRLTISEDIEVNVKPYGTIIKIPCNDTDDDIPAYFRIRIIFPTMSVKKQGSFFRLYRPRYFFFQNAFNVLETTDFRINEKRSAQNPDLLATIESESLFIIKAVRYFLIVPIKDELIGGSKLGYQRQLEGGGLWNNYLGLDKKKKLGEMSVYDYKQPIRVSQDCTSSVEKEEFRIEDFRIFHKLQYRKSNLLTVFWYILVSFLLVLVYNIALEVIINMLFNNGDTNAILGDIGVNLND